MLEESLIYWVQGELEQTPQPSLKFFISLISEKRKKSPLDSRPGFVFAPVSITSAFPCKQIWTQG